MICSDLNILHNVLLEHGGLPCVSILAIHPFLLFMWPRSGLGLVLGLGLVNSGNVL